MHSVRAAHYALHLAKREKDKNDVLFSSFSALPSSSSWYVCNDEDDTETDTEEDDEEEEDEEEEEAETNDEEHHHLQNVSLMMQTIAQAMTRTRPGEPCNPWMHRAMTLAFTPPSSVALFNACASKRRL